MLSALLANKLDNYSNLDQAWVQVILDHKQVIRDECNILEITDEDRSRFKFKLDHYLRENSVPVTLHWVTKFINELEMYEDFTDRKALYIPNTQILSNLYRKYRATLVIN